MNREYAERERHLVEGDEVALIPPVSGGSFRFVEGPIAVASVIAEVADERAGAVATFQGTVRSESRGPPTCLRSSPRGAQALPLIP